jgi:hypothetical protein
MIQDNPTTWTDRWKGSNQGNYPDFRCWEAALATGPPLRVSGEAGIGKSQLARAAVALVGKAQHGACVLLRPWNGPGADPREFVTGVLLALLRDPLHPETVARVDENASERIQGSKPSGGNYRLAPGLP